MSRAGPAADGADATGRRVPHSGPPACAWSQVAPKADNRTRYGRAGTVPGRNINPPSHLVQSAIGCSDRSSSEQPSRLFKNAEVIWGNAGFNLSGPSSGRLGVILPDSEGEPVRRLP